MTTQPISFEFEEVLNEIATVMKNRIAQESERSEQYSEKQKSPLRAYRDKIVSFFFYALKKTTVSGVSAKTQRDRVKIDLLVNFGQYFENTIHKKMLETKLHIDIEIFFIDYLREQALVLIQEE